MAVRGFVGPMSLWRPYLSLILERELTTEEARRLLDECPDA